MFINASLPEISYLMKWMGEKIPLDTIYITFFENLLRMT